MSRPLPRLASALRRLYPGASGAWTRARVKRTAEYAAGRTGASAATVLEEISRQHTLPERDMERLGLALERDLPAPLREATN